MTIRRSAARVRAAAVLVALAFLPPTTRAQAPNAAPGPAPQTPETPAMAANADRIAPWSENPFYWSYRGKPVLLLGGSVEDNLFQIPDLREHLDLLASVGGNYVRGTMSSRDEGNLWPFARDEATGKYDLERFDEEYWNRFEQFLRLAAEPGIVIQIEVWDRFDFAREPWQANPFNPKNNVNYAAEQSGLRETIATHPGQRENAFFRSPPELENNELLLKYQHAFVDRMLSHSLRYGNVLYCMDNETNEPPAWGAYWARYIRRRAQEAGVPVQLTEMWDAHDLDDEQHARTLDHPELYDFVDISQNNHQSGQAHWDNAQAFRRRVLASGHVRPMNGVKIYGADTGRYGTDRDGLERFWRNILGGLATSRFHRPASGLGLGQQAQAHLRSGRMFTDAMATLFDPRCVPANELLGDREPNEAYCRALPGREYAVFFPDGGEVTLDVSAAGTAAMGVRWLDIAAGRWQDAQAASPADGRLPLRAPGRGYWAVLVQAH